jgi:ribulose-5-phosphate 4-epimerase/fuculose-1-phosphate aldolase
MPPMLRAIERQPVRGRPPGGGRLTEARARRAVVAAARRMVELDLVVGSLGNVSARAGDRVLITPTASPYERMRARQLVALDVRTGRPLSRGVPSREAPLHAAVYRARPDVGAVIHTHSPNATAWSFGGQPVEPRLEELDYYGIGALRTAAYAAPGSPHLGDAAVEALGDGRAVLLARHGVLSVGADVREALTIAVVVEHQARVASLVHALGGAGDADARRHAARALGLAPPRARRGSGGGHGR